MWRRRFDISPAAGFQPGFRIESAYLDTVAPALSASIPSSGIQDVPVKVSASVTDRLSPVTITWDFGDGATAAGGSASHAYAKAGTYTVTATATDAAGNASSATGAIDIPPIPATGPDPRLAIDGLQIVPSAFRAALRGPSVKPANVKPWARVSYSVAIPAKMSFSFERPRFGRRSGAGCAKPAPSNRGNKRCVRYLPVKGSFTRTRPAGGDRFTFTGRLLGRRLKAGRYRLVARAGAGGRTGASARAAFQIQPAKRTAP
jgi:hypothetical protein